MLRLRTTASLSLLALLVGIAGTAWLSTLTSDWQGPPGIASTRIAKVRAVLRRHAHALPIAHAHAAPVAVAHTAPAPAEVPAALPTLTPIDMPPLPTSLLQRTVFTSGRVVLRLTVDGEGRVGQAAVAQSSGNVGLDDRAVRTAERWRFAVPADHPEGLSGQLVMRFDDSSATL